MAFTQDFRTQRRNYNDGEIRIGEKDRLWYDSNTNSIRISDGVTPGGVIVGSSGGGNYTLPTASTTVRGGVKIDGTTITINNGVISATQPDLSSYATQTFVTTRGYLTSYTETDPVFLAHAAHNVTNTKITNWDTAYGWGNHASAGYLTSVGTISYNDLSNKPTLFSGSYTDLTNKPTIPTTVTVNGTAITLDSSGSLNSLINGSDTLSLDGANKVNLPGGTASIFAAANVIALTSDSSGNNYFEIANNVGISLYTNRGFELRTNKGTTDRIWTFGQNGTLTFPDSTIQTTAYTTTAARGLFSAANNSASGSGGSLSYSNGVFTFTPALNITGNAATVTNGVYTTDTGTVTNTMLAGSIANNKLANSSVTVNGTSISLGASATVTAAAGTLTGTTLNSTVVSSSLTSVGTLTSLTSSGTVTINNAGVLAYGSGQLYINGATYSRIDFGNVYADPVVNGRSTGSRLIFNPGTGLGRMDSGIGMSSTTLWNSVQDPTFGFGWYAGDGLAGGSGAPVTLLTLSGAGVLTVPGGASTTNNSATNKALNIGTSGQLFDDGNLHIHATSGTLWLNSLNSGDISIGTQYNSGTGSNVNIGKNLTANSGSITANATTAFIAGSNAASGVALQMPNEAAIRNLTNGSNNMYFDVSIGGTAHGQFSFRSSSSYTSVATMSTTAVAFNTGATVTARTPALARTAFNSAIDTEITVDNMRFRVSNQGGIFPQVIGNGSSRNLAWTAVGAISGRAIAQVGSTGTIVASNAWTTLYNSNGMDSAGDTVTATLQDKAGSAIYRITFMRSDNGSTTGYNIIGERLL